MRRLMSLVAGLVLALALVPGMALAQGACGDEFTPIYTIQGNGDESPFHTFPQTVVTTEGVVTVDLQKFNEHQGFFLQDTDGDADPATSDGIFVFRQEASGFDVSVGDHVRVEAEVDEQFGQTQLENVISIDVCGTAEFEATEVEPRQFNANSEQYEGLYVRFESKLFVTDTFNLHNFGEVWVGEDGVIEQPTNEFPGGSAEMLAFAVDNMAQSVLIEDRSRLSNPSPVPFLREDGTLRLGDMTANPNGAIRFAFGEYRLVNSVHPVFETLNDRPDAPDLDGEVMVASFNVLNYWTTLGGRGATTAAQLEAQTDKLVAAILGTGADIVGLQEVENDPDHTPITTLVAELNDAAGDNVWSWIGEVNHYNIYPIRNEIIYRNDRVTPVGDPISLADPAFDDFRPGGDIPDNQLGRPPVAQTFEADGAIFTVMVNHFKSKSAGGATGADGDQGDGQSAFNARRVLQAMAVLDFVDELVESSGDPDVIVIGDLNAYHEEDPILELETDLDNLVKKHVRDPYSFNFFARSSAPFIGRGALDHAFATPSMGDQVEEVVYWHINADEPRFLDWFNPAVLAPGPYRSSDHDPLLIGLDLDDD